MKALIIAAGRGSRFNELTEDKPKALIPLLGLPLIERVIFAAKEGGIKEYVIVVGYLGEKIKAVLGNGNRLRVKIDYVENREWQKGNGVSVLKARELLNENFFLLMSDHIFDARILRALLNYGMKGALVLAVDRKEALSGDTKVLEKNGKIVDIGTDIEKSNCIDTGIFLCSPKVFSYLQASVEESKTELSEGIRMAAQNMDAEVFDIALANLLVPNMGRQTKTFWMDIDVKEDVHKAEKLLVEKLDNVTNSPFAPNVGKPMEKQGYSEKLAH